MHIAVILTDTGTIKETIIKFERDISQEQVNTLNLIFNNKLKGQSLATIDKPMEQYIMSEMNYRIDVIKPIIKQISRAINDEEQIYLKGANKTFENPEFESSEFARNFMNLLDSKNLILDLLENSDDFKVYIGNEINGLKDFSIVTFKNKVGGKDLGTIGIIGPTRMDYSKVISVMKYISKELNKELGSGNQKK